MTRGIGPDSAPAEKAFFNGAVTTVEELRQRFTLAVLKKNIEILDILLIADRPLSAGDIRDRLAGNVKYPLHSTLCNLFASGFVVRLSDGRNRRYITYLLSEAGYKKIQELKGTLRQ